MQILRLIEIQGFIDGGSSRPLLITAVDEGGEAKQFVMKLFKTDWVEQNYSVAKEIFIAELAKDFSLVVPNYGLIDIDHKFLEPFFKPEEIERFDSGLKFCSEFISQSTPLITSLTSLKFIKQYDIENLFCFDNLIFNVDRGGQRNKPNLLINDEEIILIDHEQTLPFINSTLEDVNYFNYVRFYEYGLHIATPYLRRLQQKENLFDEFFESLRTVNINNFNTLFDRMDVLNVNYGDRDKILAYLNWAKNQISFLNNHLISIIK